MEDLRTMLKLLKLSGKTYKTIAEESGVSYGVIRNFACGYSETIKASNAAALKEYLDRQNIESPKI